MARIGLVLALFQAVIGLASGSEQLYLAQPVIINGLYGVAFVGSVALRRPLAGAFADEMYPFPDFVRSSETFRRVFSHVSLMWGAYLLARSALRLLTLQHSSVEAFLGVNFITGVPLTALLLATSDLVRRPRLPQQRGVGPGDRGHGRRRDRRPDRRRHRSGERRGSSLMPTRDDRPGGRPSPDRKCVLDADALGQQLAVVGGVAEQQL